MKISWFLPDGEGYVRVEEELVSLSENDIIFSQNRKNFKLKSAYNLKELLIDDVLYAFQLKDRLYPIRGSPKYNSEFAIRKYIDVDPEKLKEIIAKATADLKKEIDKIKDLIQFEIKKNAEDDLKKMDFLQNVDSYREIIYKKFLDFFKSQSDDIQSKLEEINESIKNNEDSELKSLKLKHLSERNSDSAILRKIEQNKSGLNNNEDKRESVNLLTPSKKQQIRRLFQA